MVAVETVEKHTARLKGIVQRISDHRDVDGLCREFLDPLQDVVKIFGLLM